MNTLLRYCEESLAFTGIGLLFTLPEAWSHSLPAASFLSSCLLFLLCYTVLLLGLLTEASITIHVGILSQSISDKVISRGHKDSHESSDYIVLGGPLEHVDLVWKVGLTQLVQDSLEDLGLLQEDREDRVALVCAQVCLLVDEELVVLAQLVLDVLQVQEAQIGMLPVEDSIVLHLVVLADGDLLFPSAHHLRVN